MIFLSRLGDRPKDRSQETPHLAVPKDPIVAGVFFVVNHRNIQFLQDSMDHLVERIQVVVTPAGNEQRRQSGESLGSLLEPDRRIMLAAR